MIFLLYGIAAIPLNYCLHLLPFKAGTIFLIVIFMNISVGMYNWQLHYYYCHKYNFLKNPHNLVVSKNKLMFLLVIILNISILLPLVEELVQNFQRRIIKFVLHTIPPYVLGCAIGNYITLFLFDHQCKKFNMCNTDYRFVDPCCCKLN